MRKRGIFYLLNFLFGLDEDTPDVFEATIQFLEEIKAPIAFFNTVTPRKGTPMRKRLEDEGQVILPEADRYTNNFRCMFILKHMTPEQVEDGTWWCTSTFYSLSSIAWRMLLPPSAYTPQGISSNLFFCWGAKWRIDPVDYY